MADICTHFLANCKKDLGFYGKDAPSKLIKYVMKSIKQRESKIDAFIINGDFVEHGIALNNSTGNFKETWAKMKEIITNDMNMIRSEFPDASLLPSIGNNDVVVHNQVPCDSETSKEYYSELFDIWFPAKK